MSYTYTCPVCQIAKEGLPDREAAEVYREAHREHAHEGARPHGESIDQPEADFAFSGKAFAFIAFVLVFFWAAYRCGG